MAHSNVVVKGRNGILHTSLNEQLRLDYMNFYLSGMSLMILNLKPHFLNRSISNVYFSYTQRQLIFHRPLDLNELLHFSFCLLNTEKTPGTFSKICCWSGVFALFFLQVPVLLGTILVG